MVFFYFLICTLICSYFLFLSINNARSLRRLSYPAGAKYFPGVSVLLPARNEEGNIRRCLDSLLDQDYPNYHIVALDDNSTDSTGEILLSYAACNPSVTALTGKPLPAGWLGKPFACQQLLEASGGEYCMFTDADTVHSRSSVSWAVTNMQAHRADFMSAYVRHTLGSIGEAVLVPVVYLLSALIIPLWLVPEANHSLVSFAIGQLIVAKKSVLRALGGFTGVRNCVVEDLALARIFKARFKKTVFLDARDYISARMYSSYMEAFNGLARVVFPAIFANVFLLVGLMILLFGVIVFPVFFIVVSVLGGGNDYLVNALIPVVLFLLAWLQLLSDRRLPLVLALLYPILFANLLVIAVVSFLKTGIGRGAEWKGRYVRCGISGETRDSAGRDDSGGI